nr:Chain A, Antigen TpF1 [Treponema pallidum]2FJC_B Chain B, Antigen TpF1 [Treponema pallidum]2FJC_C Chain C, Antigen TpF1 [Treponema pallidum]2FJC_D Chain D, Antigen TpF1 [Treponema pallidum]2FJC_E Chain E, Antigen TpF1 [Treponema pallidum]2FJC_F Chain F, Antigen TpF1 [Treponema pallidum]2FJC_G Chain G, Antigen TpF1 [Treponema pallidum]2FJC_H Chain H, Antigen TpF1 [Treponema pallidum]2FJC_I Chain I, Antigen TpF1 [Treponema pallidum]2FJC_J Chain J, Antigen TpF1 [Treponema pallidum]2FJC_K 
SAPGVPDARAIAAICEQLRQHVADLGVLYIKLHNYHWHIYGIEFKQVHELLEEYYVSVTEAFDTIAERLLQLGAQAPASMAEYLALSGIAEETEKEITIVSALARVKRDFEYLSTRFSQTQVLAAESGDAVTDGIITDILRTLGKAIWMLGATLKA